MLWSIDGFEVEILLQAEEGVRVVQWDATAKVVSVQASLPKAEAIWCIRKLANSAVAAEPQVRMDRLEVFDRSWPLKVISNGVKPYIYKDIVHAYVPAQGLSVAQRDRLLADILREQLLYYVGIWEERLGCLIYSISIRKFKTKAYSICLKKKMITFDRNMYQLKLEVVNYGVFMAIATYENLAEEKLHALRQQYFPLYRNYEKLLAYEYRGYTGDKY